MSSLPSTPGLREGRVRSEAADTCPWAPRDMWLPAGALADLALRNVGKRPPRGSAPSRTTRSSSEGAGPKPCCAAERGHAGRTILRRSGPHLPVAGRDRRTTETLLRQLTPPDAMSPRLPPVDHLVWGGRSLTQEIERLERLTGVRPAPGGRHPSEATHNALLGLGPAMYLELIAPDPDQTPPSRRQLVRARHPHRASARYLGRQGRSAGGAGRRRPRARAQPRRGAEWAPRARERRNAVLAAHLSRHAAWSGTHPVPDRLG